MYSSDLEHSFIVDTLSISGTMTLKEKLITSNDPEKSAAVADHEARDKARAS